MAEPMHSREYLESRREEINAQLEKTNEDERIELDSDMEEQAIQTEQHEVAVTMEENLRRELTHIEETLAEMDE